MSLLRLENLSLRFKGENEAILNDLNYSISLGDFVILLGSNGSGKSSLLKLLHRDYEASSGQIYFKDSPLSTYPRVSFIQEVAILTQNCDDSLFTSLSLYENYLLVKREPTTTLFSQTKEREFLAHYVSDYNPNLAHKLDVAVAELSGGEKQALALAFCLLQHPTLLLLDEHTSALDPKTSEQIMQLTQDKIKQHHITCILTTHDLDIALAYGNRILMLHDGKIYKTFDSEAKAKLSKESLVGSYY